MVAVRAARPGEDYFATPEPGPQRRHEALRAYLPDGEPAAAVAQPFGYTTTGLHSAVRDLRAHAVQDEDCPDVTGRLTGGHPTRLAGLLLALPDLLAPAGFFDREPALDVAPQPGHGGVHCTTDDAGA